MKRMIYLIIAVAMLSGCSAQKKLVSVDKNTNEAVVKKGQELEIEFITNASTGYAWKLLNANDIDIVEPGDSRYTSNAPKGVVGASSHRFWKFKALRKGTQTLHFVYARGDVPEGIRTRDVTVTVK